MVYQNKKEHNAHKLPVLFSIVLESPNFAAATKVGMKVKLESKSAGSTHRMSPLKNTWPIYPPLVVSKLQVRMNLKTKTDELKTSEATDPGAPSERRPISSRRSTPGFDVDDAYRGLDD